MTAEGGIDRKQVAREMLTLVQATGAHECRQLVSRFRQALLRANPEVSPERMIAFDQAFERELPALVEAFFEARVEAAVNHLTTDQIAACQSILSDPAASVFFEGLRTLGPIFRTLDEELAASRGTTAYERSAESLFAALAQESASTRSAN